MINSEDETKLRRFVEEVSKRYPDITIKYDKSESVSGEIYQLVDTKQNNNL